MDFKWIFRERLIREILCKCNFWFFKWVFMKFRLFFLIFSRFVGWLWIDENYGWKLLEWMRDLRFVCYPSELMDCGRFWGFSWERGFESRVINFEASRLFFLFCFLFFFNNSWRISYHTIEQKNPSRSTKNSKKR